MRLRLLAPFALAAILAPAALAQQGAWLDIFSVPGVGGALQYGHGVYALARDGNVRYAAGLFEYVDGVPARNVAAWDGTAWRALGGGVDNPKGGIASQTVKAMAVAPDGDLYVAGFFTHAFAADGTPIEVNGVARWDGAAWHPLGHGLRAFFLGSPTAAFALTLDTEGRLIVGGDFYGAMNADGTQAISPNVVRWNGTAWEALGDGLGGPVYAVAAEPDGAVVVGGRAPSIASGSVSGLALRWRDGDGWNAIGGPHLGFSGMVHALTAVDGSLYVGGAFGTVQEPDGTTRTVHNVARWDGTRWHGLGDGVGTRNDDFVDDIVLDPAGGVLVAGRFLEGVQSGGDTVSSPGLIRWTGTAWASEDGIVHDGVFDQQLAAHVLLAEGPDTALVGGDFGSVRRGDGGVRPMRSLARRSGGAWMPVSAITNDDGIGSTHAYVRALATTPCGPVLAGGAFRHAGTSPAGGLAAWDGAGWQAFVGAEFRSVQALSPTGCVGGVPTFYVGGFSEDLLAYGGVAYWNGTAWVPLGRGTDGIVHALAIDDDGVYVGGIFVSVYDADDTRHPYRSLAHWSPEHGWSSLGGGLSAGGEIYAIALGPDGALYASGFFPAVEQADGTVLEVPGLARWTGTAWESIGGPTFYPYEGVSALGFDATGALVIGGNFTSLTNPGGATVTAHGVARWDAGGWQTLSGGLPNLHVRTLVADATGALFAGGGPTLPGSASERLYRWDGETWTPIGIGPDGIVWALTHDRDGRLYAGGSFSVVGGNIPSPYIAVWGVPFPVAVAPDPPETPRTLALAASPNPATRAATLTFTLSTPGHARLVVYDALGRAVAVLADGPHAAGNHEAHLDAAKLPAGVYLARLEADAQTATRALTVLR